MLTRFVVVKDENSFINKSVKAMVVDLPYKGPENLKEIINYDPYIIVVQMNDVVVEITKKKKKSIDSDEKKKRVKENFGKIGELQYSDHLEKLMVYDTTELNDNDSDKDPSSFFIAAPNRCLDLLHEVIRYDEI